MGVEERGPGSASSFPLRPPTTVRWPATSVSGCSLRTRPTFRTEAPATRSTPTAVTQQQLPQTPIEPSSSDQLQIGHDPVVPELEKEVRSQRTRSTTGIDDSPRLSTILPAGTSTCVMTPAASPFRVNACTLWGSTKTPSKCRPNFFMFVVAETQRAQSGHVVVDERPDQRGVCGGVGLRHLRHHEAHEVPAPCWVLGKRTRGPTPGWPSRSVALSLAPPFPLGPPTTVRWPATPVSSCSRPNPSDGPGWGAVDAEHAENSPAAANNATAVDRPRSSDDLGVRHDPVVPELEEEVRPKGTRSLARLNRPPVLSTVFPAGTSTCVMTPQASPFRVSARTLCNSTKMPKPLFLLAHIGRD